MRAVDLQTIIYRMQEIDREQTQASQQPRMVQGQLAQNFLQDVQNQQRQVYTAPRAEGTRVRENENSRERRQERRRQRQQQEEPDEEQDRPSPNIIDVRV